MRFITKGASPFFLEKRHISYLDDVSRGVDSPDAWDNFRMKRELTGICLGEQFHLCAYSEVDLQAFAHGMHLEHIVPRSVGKNRIFEYDNIVACAINDKQLRGLDKQLVFGGHFKLDQYDDSLFISPLTRDCGRYFHYRGDGMVEPSIALTIQERKKAEYTIDTLNLNSDILVNMRRNWLSELEVSIEQCIDAQVGLEEFADMELCLTGDRLRPFHSAVRQRFGALGERVILSRCPECA